MGMKAFSGRQIIQKAKPWGKEAVEEGGWCGQNAGIHEHSFLAESGPPQLAFPSRLPVGKRKYF